MTILMGDGKAEIHEPQKKPGVAAGLFKKEGEAFIPQALL